MPMRCDERKFYLPIRRFGRWSKHGDVPVCDIMQNIRKTAKKHMVLRLRYVFGSIALAAIAAMPLGKTIADVAALLCVVLLSYVAHEVSYIVSAARRFNDTDHL